MLKPAARADLAKSNVGDEVVVYDFRTHHARCLNRTAAAVFELCDGTRTPRQIAAELGKRLGEPVNERLVWLSLAKLDEGGLFERPLGIARTDLRRRALLKKMAMTAGLSIALPAVWSIVAPTPAYAASLPVQCVPAQACMGGQMGQCCNNNGMAAVCQPDGTCSGSNSQCSGQPCR
jgi:coenzyme PQQ synthesis protein D (PqqD)